MKLYLSSSGIQSPSALQSLIGRPLGSCIAAVIPNAKDGLKDADRESKIKDAGSLLSNLGIGSKIVDLRDFRDPSELAAVLDSFDLIWVMGGDPFRLRYQMRQSGFDVVARKLEDMGVVYAAESAGAIVAGGSLRGFEVKSDNAEIPDVIWEGLHLVSSPVLPHIDIAYFADAVDQVRKALTTSSIVELRQDQAAVFDGLAFKVVEAETGDSYEVGTPA